MKIDNFNYILMSYTFSDMSKNLIFSKKRFLTPPSPQKFSETLFMDVS